LEVALVNQAMIRMALGAELSATSHAVELLLHQRFPELGAQLPRKRRPWEAESGRSRIIRALGIATAAAQLST
jgi:hypothetical protein